MFGDISSEHILGYLLPLDVIIDVSTNYGWMIENCKLKIPIEINTDYLNHNILADDKLKAFHTFLNYKFSYACQVFFFFGLLVS